MTAPAVETTKFPIDDFVLGSGDKNATTLIIVAGPATDVSVILCCRMRCKIEAPPLLTSNFNLFHKLRDRESGRIPW